MKPGKPVGFGVRRDHLVFNLPGNPVSALVCFEVLVRPAINALLGSRDPIPPYAHGFLAETMPRNSERDEFVRARRERSGDRIELRPVVGQDSHMIVAAAQADALIHVPRGQGELPAGSEARYLPL